MPWILCAPGWPPDSTAEASGSTATIFTDGLRAFRTWPTPVMVPAGADAGDDRVDAAVGVVPDLLGRRDPVDQRVGLVLELLGHDRAGTLAQISWARATAPRMPFSAGVSSSSAPRSAASCAAPATCCRA
jgi:hypothetical protein